MDVSLALGKMSQLLISYMSVNEDEIFEHFRTLEGAIYSEEYPRWLYAPGWRRDKMLLVAHTDTVWSKKPEKFIQKGDLIYSDFKVVKSDSGRIGLSGVGIGADDRAGVAGLWLLRGSGHSLFLTEGEEIGTPSYIIAQDQRVQQLISEHRYALELDRQGHSNFVCYNDEPFAFRKWLAAGLGFDEEQGTFSDIKPLCEDRICSANVAIGYQYQHSIQEFLNVSHFALTIARLSNLLEKEQPGWSLF